MEADSGSGGVPVIEVAIFHIGDNTIFVGAAIGGGIVGDAGVNLGRIVGGSGAVGDVGGEGVVGDDIGIGRGEGAAAI